MIEKKNLRTEPDAQANEQVVYGSIPIQMLLNSDTTMRSHGAQGEISVFKFFRAPLLIM